MAVSTPLNGTLHVTGQIASQVGNIGGALGNILDRLHEGSVTDFIKFPLGWPPFNLADTSITLGVLLLLVVLETPRKESS